MALRDEMKKKYGAGTSTSQTSVSNVGSNTLRDSLMKKYSAPAYSPVSEDGMALDPTKVPKSSAKQTPVSVRQSVAEKYAQPKAKEPVKQEPIVSNTGIASPEYFATSVDVRSSSGKFLKTFKSETPGEAKAMAEAYAQQKEGYIQVTPPAGVFGRIFTRVQESFKASLDKFAEKGSQLGRELGGVQKNPNGPNMIANPDSGPISRGASMVEFGVAGVEVLLSPLSAAFMGAEEVPVAGVPVQGINYIFGKVGEGGGWAANKAVDSLPVSDKTKEQIRPAATELSTILAQIAAGKAGEVGIKKSLEKTKDLREDIKTKITKDIIETNQLPRNVYITPESVRSLFVDESNISAFEADMVKSLGLDGKGYRDALKNGLSIEIPAERIITIVDKPWFASVKGIFNIEPSSVRIVDTTGKIVKKDTPLDVKLLEEGKTPKTPGEAVLPAKIDAENAIYQPITSKLLETVNAFTPLESSAFGKKIVDTINETLGTSIDAAEANLPGNIKLINSRSGDSRPAQFKSGKIEIFVPNLLEDLKSLAEGKQIMAHEGEFSTVYKKKDGESMEELSTRYVRDIIIHEAAHQKTMTLADQNAINKFISDINAAKLAQDSKGTIAARKKLTDFMRSIEDKANAYMRDNREALEKEFLGGPARKTQTEIQRQISKTTNKKIPTRTPAKITEKQALTQRIKARVRGNKEGREVGKQKEDVAVANVQKYYQDMIGRMNDKKFSRIQKQSALVDYAQILPFRERGKFLKAIRNTITQKDFLKVLEQMREASKAAERRVLISKISEELKGTIVKKRNGIPNAKFELEAQRTLNEMRSLQKSMTYQEAQVAIANKISDWQTANPDAAIPVELLREVEVLKTVGIKDQSVAELSYTLSAIQSLKETGRTKKEIEIFNRESDIQMKKDKIYDIITGGKDLPSDKLSVKNRTRKDGVIQATKKFLTEQQYGWEEILDVLSMRDKTSKPYESFLSKEIGDKTNTAFNKQNRGELTQIDIVSKGMREVYGLKKNTEVLQTLGALKELRILGEFKHADGVVRTLELSRGEAMQYYMWMQDPTLLETFTDTLNWTPEIMETVKASLKPEDIKMAEYLIEDFYPKYYESINQVYNKEYGVDLPFNPNYSPVHRAIDAAIPENVLLAQESAKYATARNGSLKDRQKSRLDLKPTDAFENVMRHVVKMEHYKAWSEPMFEMRRIFGDRQIRQAITDIHGPGYMKVTDNFLNDFARDGVAREKVIKAVDTLRMNVTKALLGLNLNVGIKQLPGILSYGIELPVKDLTVGVADFWKNPIDKAKFLYDESGTLQERFSDGFERDIKSAIERGYDKKLAKANNLGEMLFVFTRNFDKLVVYQGAWATYKSYFEQAKRAGKTDAEAKELGIRAAENITNRVQESSRLDTLSPIQRGGSIAKLFTMLAGQPNKYLRIMNNAGRNYKAGRQSGMTAAKRVAWAWFVAPFIYNLIADQLIDEEYRDTPGGLVTRTLLGPLSYPLVVGQLFQQIYGWTQGERFAFQASPVESFSNDIQKAIQNYQAEDMVDAVTYILDMAGKLGGVPTTLITRPIREANKEEEATESAGSVSF